MFYCSMGDNFMELIWRQLSFLQKLFILSTFFPQNWDFFGWNKRYLVAPQIRLVISLISANHKIAPKCWKHIFLIFWYTDTFIHWYISWIIFVFVLSICTWLNNSIRKTKLLKSRFKLMMIRFIGPNRLSLLDRHHKKILVYFFINQI